MGIYRSPKEVKLQYGQSTALNQSSIKKILKDGMQSFIIDMQKTLEDENYETIGRDDKEFLVVGSAVDTLVTGYEGEYFDTYIISESVELPGPKTKAVIDHTYQLVSATSKPEDIVDLSFYRKQIWEACEYVNFNKRSRKDDFEADGRALTILKETTTEPYWNYLTQVESKGKKLVTPGEDSLVTKIHDLYMNHPFTAEYFASRNGVDILFQVPVYFTYRGVKCKGLIDMLYVDHVFKTIKIIDVKTIGRPVLMFNRQFRKLRYDIQISFYNYGFKECIGTIGEILGRNVSEYTVKNAFIVESTVMPGTPLVFPVIPHFIEYGRIGNPEEGVYGWEHGVEIYKTWAENNFSLEDTLKTGTLIMKSDYNYINTI